MSGFAWGQCPTQSGLSGPESVIQRPSYSAMLAVQLQGSPVATPTSPPPDEQLTVVQLAVEQLTVVQLKVG